MKLRSKSYVQTPTTISHLKRWVKHRVVGPSSTVKYDVGSLRVSNFFIWKANLRSHSPQ